MSWWKWSKVAIFLASLPRALAERQGVVSILDTIFQTHLSTHCSKLWRYKTKGFAKRKIIILAG